jgi:hypothetical protein
MRKHPEGFLYIHRMTCRIFKNFGVWQQFGTKWPIWCSVSGRHPYLPLSTVLVSSSAKWVSPGESGERPILGTSLAHAHIKVCRPIATVGKKAKRQYIFPKDFVLHSLRHTCLTRLGEASADAFTIMRLAGHSSVTVSQRYVHPTPESMERAFDRLEALNSKAMERANGVESPQNSPHLLASTS